MANKELITCDYAGCDKPFAYRVKGFNLCHTHLSEGEPEPWWMTVLRKVKRNDATSTNQ